MVAQESSARRSLIQYDGNISLRNNIKFSFFSLFFSGNNLVVVEEAGEEGGLAGGGAEGAEVVVVGLAVGDEAVDDAPVGEAADVAVVDVELGIELAAAAAVEGLGGLIGIVAVDGEELDAAGAAVVEGVLEKGAFADCPKDELVAVGDELAEGGAGEGFLAPYVGVSVLDDSSVEINCYGHA